MEYRGILTKTEMRKEVQLDIDWACLARLNGHDALLTANGAGYERATAAVDCAAREFHPDALISTGYCGALDPKLRIGDVVVADSLDGRAEVCRTPVTGGRISYVTGAVVSIDHVARTADEKQSLHARGAIAVEMEAAGIAERAAKMGIPFYCVRAVTDLAGEDMANDFNSALRADGHFDTMRIFRSALSHPVARIPELIRLRQSCMRAASTLGEFFADCQF